MKYIVHKAFWDYEKEERWLNEMSAKGLALTDCSWMRHVFADAPNNEYIYRLELLEKLPTHPESMAYLRFLEENGVECVSTSGRWAYLRKKSSEGSFDIYTDSNSRLKHYKRIYACSSVLMWVELIAGLANLITGLVNINVGYKLGNFTAGNIILGVTMLLLAIIFFLWNLPLYRKIKRLKQQKAIME
ncbi:DUF2812 domain-containing protein [Acetanaerobacterium elongatum]|uniref:DUF2812 domain-containing protein n=1 Tax=Acetanaerobacterium elongatum TaxID=258515 RepID=A0A1H0GW60_9FIRM|nr:DUF2812 domain-containing protein [Acetanaerobacterium elongatum]SDO11099.1 Protein of unknown function [Acetanaerobacterium elongatum]